MKGFKHDQNKPRWELLPFTEMKEIVEVLTIGAQKYKDNNWQYVTPSNRYIGALFRHLTAWIEGEKLDPETGKSHLAHAGCNLLFLMWVDNNKKKQRLTEKESDLFEMSTTIEND